MINQWNQRVDDFLEGMRNFPMSFQDINNFLTLYIANCDSSLYFGFTFKAMICEIHSVSWNVKVEMFSSHQIELGHCFSISQRTILILILILEPSRKVIKWSFHRPKLVLFGKLIAFEWWKKWHILENIIKNWKEIKNIVACRSRNIIFLKIMQNPCAAAGAKKLQALIIHIAYVNILHYHKYDF